MEPFFVDGELVEVVGPRQAKVKSRSQATLWYAVDLEDRGGEGSCTCRGFEIRKTCRHLTALRELVAGQATTAADVPILPFELSTSRYPCKSIDEASMIPVGITVGNPRFKLAYKLVAIVKELAPVGLKDVGSDEEFERLYRVRLDSFGLAYFQRRLSELVAASSGKTHIVLLCYEDLAKPGEVCHRRMFASWWQEKTGIEVPELSGIAPEALFTPAGSSVDRASAS